jgi:hypothetical protein
VRNRMAWFSMPPEKEVGTKINFMARIPAAYPTAAFFSVSGVFGDT